MTKYFIAAFNPDNSVLGVKTPIGQVAGMHYKSMIDMFEGQLWLPYGYGLYLWVICFLLMLYKKSTRAVALNFIGFFIFSYIFYLVFYHHPLKVWYLQGFRIWYLFVLGAGLSIGIDLVNKVNPKPLKVLIFSLLLVFLFRNFYLVLLDKFQVIVRSETSNDPKNAKNILYTLDWVYKNSKQETFEAYSYVPEVYEYPYQYLYWWYGKKTYGYRPSVASYSLNDVPIYLNMADRFIKQPVEEKLTKLP
jgi:hypothetical protein